MSWRPILDGDAAAPAHEAIRAIGDTLADSIQSQAEADSPAVAARYASLVSGRAGLALFYAYRERAGHGGHGVAGRLLGEAIERAMGTELGLSLCEGLTGVAWAAAHLKDTTPGAAALQRQVSANLLLALERPATPDAPVDYDLLYGLVGLGVYALERLPEPGAVALLERIVDRLDELAERRADTITWWTPPALTHAPARFPTGWYNLGVAHGVPAIVALLALACRAGVAAGRARPMLDGAVTWLLAQRLPGPGAAFPSYVGAGIDPRPARLAWCYGDLGLTAALLVAARAVGQPSWEQTAIELALRAADRSPEESSVVDAPLCHGSIGVGHVFNRLFQVTGEGRLGDAARYWLERGLAMRRPGGKLGGFHALMPGPDGRPRRPVAHRGLLYGAAGIGLALLAATTDIEPAWDRVLLLS
jgi:hypothetical protein